MHVKSFTEGHILAAVCCKVARITVSSGANGVCPITPLLAKKLYITLHTTVKNVSCLYEQFVPYSLSASQ
jgi:hypothetical protein